MSDVTRYAKELFDLAEHAQEFKEKVNSTCGGSFKWGIQEVIDSYLSMFERFCPYKIGDSVRLSKDVIVDENSGWWNCRHFLKKGAVATVKERGYSRGKFTFYIEFYDETWIDRNGDERPVSSKHTFHFGEGMLEPCN